MNSKTKLGIIVLAFALLRKLEISAPRLVSAAAERLGLSRKTGYQSAREIGELLAAEGKDSDGEVAERRELARLRIRVQILTFERDHPEVRFSERGRHLPAEARSLCVRLLRDFSSELSATEVAATIGVPLPSLERWERAAGPDCRFPPKPDRRGKHRRASAEDVERVLGEYRSLERPMSLEEFAERFNARHPDSTLDRKTLTRILRAHGEREIETPSPEKPARGHFEVYFPGAQIAVDGTETEVCFSTPPTEALRVTKEVAIDIASSAIVGDAVGTEETAEGVERVLVEARKECGAILATLSDNGSANRSGRIAEASKEETEVGQVFSFPRHPWTNGHLEGLFGQFARIVGTIVIDDSSRQALATSIVEIVWRIFIYFHNYSPRKRLGGLGPLEYLRRYAATPAEVDEARAGLEKRRRRSEDLRRPHPRLSDPRFGELIEGIVGRHRLEVDTTDALKALLPYDEAVIHSASRAFFAAAARDGFDERKRNFLYFMGIVRNKQKEIDAERLRRQLESEEAERRRAQARATECERERKKAQELEDLKHHPERVVLHYARMLLLARMRYMQRIFGDGLRRGLVALRNLGRSRRAQLEELADTIRSWGEFSEELKAAMVDMLYREHAAITDSS